MKISEISIKRPVFATMMIGALLVMGLFSYTDLPVELWPQVEFPFVVVQTTYPGASAETIETEVTKEIEEAVNQIGGIRHITSRAQEGFTFTFVEFQLSVDPAEASQEVREKVAGIREQLPDGIDEPIVSRFDFDAQAVMSVTLAGERPQQEITELAKETIKPRLEAINGVGSVDLIGGREREILISANPLQMEAYQVSVNDLREAVSLANLEIPGGRIDESGREYVVRVKGKLTTINQFSSLVVVRNDGEPVFLSDVATVIDTTAEQRSLSRFNGASAVALSIVTQSGANVVDMADDIRGVIESMRKELPPDMSITIVEDQSTWINDSIHEIVFNIQFGTLLAVLVIFLFLLDIRPTVITGLSIPISIIGTFTVMRLLGFTINFMTLLGLSLAVGILIDDSIVVVENIYRKIQGGESPVAAAFSGTREIGLAVSATTFAIMVVFLPVAFMEGIVGRFFYQFGMTVASAVLISLFVAFSLVPMLTSRSQAPRVDAESLLPANASGFRRLWLQLRRPLNLWNRAFDMLKPAYERLLRGSLHHRWAVMLLAIGAFAGAIFILGSGQIGAEFQAKTDQGKLYIAAKTAPGSTLEATAEIFEQIEDLVSELDEVTSVFVTIGGTNKPVTEGVLLLLLTDANERELSSLLLADSLRTLLRTVPGVKTSVATEVAEGGSAKPIEFSIRGENRDKLTELSRQVQKIITEMPGTTDIDNSLEEGKPELQIDIDRQLASDLGLNVMSVSQTIRSLVEGEVLTQFKDGDRDYDVRLRLEESFRQSRGAIGRIMVESTKEIDGVNTFLVPVDRVATISRESAIGEYLRQDRLPDVRVNANVRNGFFSGSVTSEAAAMIDSTVQVPPGYVIEPVGEQEMMEESSRNIMRALVLAIIFIYLLLASQYESFTDPLSIMLSLPMSLIGAVLALWVSGSSINIMTQIGIVMLMGLVTKNAILLIDFVKQERRRGVDRMTAVLTAGPIRLRPILMTTFATVFGMLPLALGLGPGAELRAPMARAVIGGIISSTMLTLVVVPVVYTLIEDTTGFIGRIMSALFKGKQRDVTEIDKEPIVY